MANIDFVDFEALKAEIKAELLKEMQKNPIPRGEKPWDKVKEAVIPRMTKKDTYAQYQLLTAISIVIRHALSIRSLSFLTFDKVETAKKIADQILDIIESSPVHVPTGTE